MKQFTQNKFLVLLVAILLIANLGLMLYFFVFRHRQSYGSKPSRPVSDFIQKQVGFNPEQTTRFQQLRDQHKEAMKPVIGDIKRFKDSLYNLLRNPEAHDSVAIDLAGKIGEKEKERELMVFHHFQKVRIICDSNQLPKFDSLVHRMIVNGPGTRKKRPPDR